MLFLNIKPLVNKKMNMSLNYNTFTTYTGLQVKYWGHISHFQLALKEPDMNNLR